MGLAALQNHPEVLRTLTQATVEPLTLRAWGRGHRPSGHAEGQRGRVTKRGLSPRQTRSTSSTDHVPYGALHTDGWCGAGGLAWLWGQHVVPSLLPDAALVLVSAPNASERLLLDL